MVLRKRRRATWYSPHHRLIAYISRNIQVLASSATYTLRESFTLNKNYFWRHSMSPTLVEYLVTLSVSNSVHAQGIFNVQCSPQFLLTLASSTLMPKVSLMSSGHLRSYWPCIFCQKLCLPLLFLQPIYFPWLFLVPNLSWEELKPFKSG